MLTAAVSQIDHEQRRAAAADGGGQEAPSEPPIMYAAHPRLNSSHAASTSVPAGHRKQEAETWPVGRASRRDLAGGGAPGAPGRRPPGGAPPTGAPCPRPEAGRPVGGPDGSCWAGDEARSAVSVRGVIGGELAGCCCCPLVMFTAAEVRRGGGMVSRLNNSADR